MEANMDMPETKTFQEQIDRFSSRGMIVSPSDVKKIEMIGYYRIKQFAAPFAKVTEVNNEIVYDYTGLSFSDVLKRYYQDKNLRIHILHAIEKIEVALKTKVAYFLGESYGAFGYLDFSKWCDKKNYGKFEIEKRQLFFKKDLLRSISKSCTDDIKYQRNKDKDGFPTVWLALEVLTFGEVVRLVDIMSAKNKGKISSFFKCSNKELISWLKCINFVRNSCAHNMNIIDLQLETKPMCRTSWKSKLYFKKNQQGNTPSNKLAIVILIIRTLVLPINDKYSWRFIQKNISRIVDNNQKKAELLGFYDVKIAQSIVLNKNKDLLA